MATKFNPTDNTSPGKAADNPFFGHGGSYQYDPATSQTSLIERAGLEAQNSPAPQPESLDFTQE